MFQAGSRRMGRKNLARGRRMPGFVRRQLRALLDCGILSNGFLRVRCDCGHERWVAFSCKGRGLCPSCGGRRMGETAAHLVDHVLPAVPGSALLPCMAASVQRVGALGEDEGRALRRPGRRRDAEVVRVQRRRCADVDGFSLHADVCVPARGRAQLERLCRYVARPAIASERLELLADGRVRYNFKRTWRDGSVAVEVEPVDFVGKLAALVPRPRSNLVRYHGCLAPHASLRADVVKDGRGPPPRRRPRRRSPR